MSREVQSRGFTAYGQNFDISIARAVCEACSVKSNLGASQHLF
jgi:hypothetical protein